MPKPGAVSIVWVSRGTARVSRESAVRIEREQNTRVARRMVRTKPHRHEEAGKSVGGACSGPHDLVEFNAPETQGKSDQFDMPIWRPVPLS